VVGGTGILSTTRTGCARNLREGNSQEEESLDPIAVLVLKLKSLIRPKKNETFTTSYSEGQERAQSLLKTPRRRVARAWPLTCRGRKNAAKETDSGHQQLLSYAKKSRWGERVKTQERRKCLDPRSPLLEANLHWAAIKGGVLSSEGTHASV